MRDGRVRSEGDAGARDAVALRRDGCARARAGDRCRADAVVETGNLAVVCDRVGAAGLSVPSCRLGPAWCGRRAASEGSLRPLCRPARTPCRRCPQLAARGEVLAVERSHLRGEERRERRDSRTIRPHILAVGVDGRQETRDSVWRLAVHPDTLGPRPAAASSQRSRPCRSRTFSARPAVSSL
jgi:hypothetical protein